MPTHCELAMLCDRAYREHTFVKHDVEVLKVDTGDKTLLAFRGSEWARGSGRAIDWLRNLRVMPWFDHRVGWCHSGFLKGAALAFEHYLRPTLDREKPIIVTGHSLGGALALVAALLIKHQGFHVDEVVTFGAPKALVGSRRRFGSTHVTQYVFQDDIVPTLLWYLPYRHIDWTQLGHKGRFFERTWSDHSMAYCYIPALKRHSSRGA